LQANRKADGKQRQDADAERIGRKRVEPQTAERRRAARRHDVCVQGGVNHQRRQQIHLRAEQLRGGKNRFANTARNAAARIRIVLNISIFHGNKTQTCSSAPRLAVEFHARLGVKAELGLARIHDLADGNARRKNPAEPLVMTFWPGFKFAPPER
jgi:hypothetical protein